MISSWRRRKEARQDRKTRAPSEYIEMELTIPNQFRCPISLDLMKDPVTMSTGITYDRQSIETWIKNGNCTCPITNQELVNLEPPPNHSLRRLIQDWCVENKSYGIERIPTPRTPVSSIEIIEILSKLSGDQEVCLNAVQKIKALAKESERNRRILVTNGAGEALSKTFEAFSDLGVKYKSGIVEEVLSSLTLMLPLEERAKSHLGSPVSLRAMVWLLGNGDFYSRRNSVLVLKDVLCLDKKKVEAFVEIEGAIEGLFKLIKDPVSITTTKASLMTIYHVLNSLPSSPQTDLRAKFVKMGVVNVLLEMLVDSEKSISEKALAVLDEICGCDEGRKRAYDHELTIPILVKKLLRVSDLATDFSVSIMWKLSKKDKRVEEGLLVEALQVGAFQKLLLLLQVGCCDKTKEKASELLKAMNVCRDRCECIDSSDFKNLRRPF